MLNNYDRIANYYDVLSRMVFFRSQVKAQQEQLHYIPANSRVLIVGGGTGWILDDICSLHEKGLHITYVEISGKMLALSEKRKTGANTVEFVHSGIEEFVGGANYDVIITAFLFDNFREKRVGQVFEQLDAYLGPAGLWLFTDFFTEVKSRWRWQTFLLKTMYLFFRYISNVEAKKLSSTRQYFAEKDYRILQERFYYGRFIKSTVYQKP